MSVSVIAVSLDPPLSKLALLLKMSNYVDCEECLLQFDCELTEHLVTEALEATLCGLKKNKTYLYLITNSSI